ncbi:MAG: acetate--CoA ligase [Bacteroidetes bacterium]|nr:acetate--CoA ligase [Bacteroidota bacterium]
MTPAYRISSFADYQTAYEKSITQPEEFWADVAQQFQWSKPWTKVLEWNFKAPAVNWFTDGKLNITENCLDRHLNTIGDKAAIIWEPNNPQENTQTISFTALHQRVCALANALLNLGIKRGDRVCLYMGMIPELEIAVLACARIGAIHSVIFGGFSAKSIVDRVQDTQAIAIITCDGAYRGAKEIPLKAVVDEALQECDSVKKVLVFTRTKCAVNMLAGRDYSWEQELEKVAASGKTTCPAAQMDSEDPLFILYTSGSTGKPKGVVHTCGGYMVWTAYTFVNVFQVEDEDIHFCTADIGWVTGHSYIIYGPLLAGTTSLMFEGIPTWPDAGRFWEIIAKHRVSILYTSPTAIRGLMSHGLEPITGKDLSSLRVLGSVGEPINEEAWHWYDEHIGKGKCPIVDTWWQTETGGIMISNLAGITPAKPSYATLPLPGVQPVLMDGSGQKMLGNSVSGNLCIQFPWPGMIRTTWGDHERCRMSYFDTYPKLYFTGDGCLRDEQGFFRITGRVDDVLNVSGHRLGTAELENAINMQEHVAESAVVPFPHDLKGQGIYAFVVLKEGIPPSDAERAAIHICITENIGPIAKPDKIQFVSGLPKTRSGKIMRRILRKIAEGEMEHLGDTTTLLDPGIVEAIKTGAKNL